MPKPDLDRVKAEKDLLHEYVYGFIAHSLLEDRDTVDFLFSNNMIYTFDFGEALMSKRKPGNRFVMHPKGKVGAFCPSGFQADFALGVAAKEEGGDDSYFRVHLPFCIRILQEQKGKD